LSGQQRFELVVLGGGLTGLALAVAVAGAGRAVAVVERAGLAVRPAEGAYDGRVTAVARGGVRMLVSVGVWPHLEASAQPILDIEVREGFSALGRVGYDHREVGGEPLGWIVENRALRDGLLARALELAGALTLVAPAEVAGLAVGAGAAEVALADGRSLRAPLVAVCEGRGSRTRERLGIGERRWPYRQTGIVCTLRHEGRPHGGRAVERFFPDGPFARLPMVPGDRSSIVWALDDALAGDVTRLGNREFLGEVGERFGDDLGELALEGPRWRYPLELMLADAYTAPRAVLVGDAARGVHPIAGQGWNLALRDVATVAEIAVDRLRLGLDPGDAAALERYAAWRRFDGMALVAVTDGINRLFANDLFPVKALRGAGLAAVERAPALKRFFMRHAMGLAGELPRAMRGEVI
jgi:2-octaprenyl-6-methoxyphenol hydroxylase